VKTLLDPDGGNGWDNLTPEFREFLNREHAEVMAIARELNPQAPYGRENVRRATAERLRRLQVAPDGGAA
jgi:hypothetical protein